LCHGFFAFHLPFQLLLGSMRGPGFSSLEAKVDGLRLQQDLLHTLKSRQLLWANHTDDMEIARIHIEIAELIQKTKDQYDRLLERYSLDNPEL
jgi:hypothetical protein